jgi:hypothetical protein
MERHFLLLRHSCLLLLTLTTMSAVSQRAATATEQTLYNFNPLQAGSLPDGGVVADAAGNLYGVAANGAPSERAPSLNFLPIRKEDGIRKFSIASRLVTTGESLKAA